MSRFTKEYTRAFTLVMGQAWFEGFAQLNTAASSSGGIPYVLCRVRDANEYWEDAGALQEFYAMLLVQNQKGPAFGNRFLDEYKAAQELSRNKRDTTPDSMEEFKEVIGAITRGMAGWCVMYYGAIDERTPATIRADLQALRAADTFGDDADTFIRGGLRKFFPHLQGFESGIARGELDTPPPAAVLQKRDAGSVMYIHGGRAVVTDQTIAEFEAAHPEYRFMQETASAGMTEVKGQTAYKGVVRGVVRVLKTRNDIASLQEGEVLVTFMTTPDFIPAMKRAGAIATDEGGIMSHAAIFARELKKPCVIGTKFATQIFKDGDMVEVDADNGVVRKISNE